MIGPGAALTAALMAYLAKDIGLDLYNALFLSPQTRGAELKLQREMFKAQQTGTTKASKEARESADKMIKQLLTMRREDVQAQRETALAQALMGSADRQQAMMMALLQGLAPGQTPRVSTIPPLSISSTLGRRYW